MKLKQLSVFIENKPGQLGMPCKVLADAGINISTLSLADTQQFGILRIIVQDWEAAKTVLEGAHFVVKETDVVAAEVDDRPGGLAAILDALDEQQINVEYMYAFAEKTGDRAIMIFCFENPDAALKILEAAGVSALDAATLFKRLSA